MNPTSTSHNDANVSFLGCGKLGTAILMGLIRSPMQSEKPRPPALGRIVASVRSNESVAKLELILKGHEHLVKVVIDDNVRATREADILILACKSSQYRALLGAPGMAEALEDKILVSVLGGVTHQDLSDCIGQRRCTVFRAMPNLAAAIGESFTLLACPSDSFSDHALEIVRSLFLASGAVKVVPANRIEAGAVVTASSPAFFASILGAVAGSLCVEGFENHDALEMAASAMRSAASLVLSGKLPRDFIQQIATVGGSTEKGLRLLEDQQVGVSLALAVEKTLEAARTLGDPVSRLQPSTMPGGAPSQMWRGAMMNAVIFKGIRHVAVEMRPVPEVQDPRDMIVKVKYSGLCGSDLHIYRGIEKCGTDFILGHEFSGTVVEIGGAVRNFEEGDQVVAPFTTSCADCFYCRNGASSRCTACLVFGSPILPGAQAEYVRIPLADTTAYKAMHGIHPQNLVLMADIFPTGFFAARNGLSRLTETQVNESVVAIIGCGPVGLCAVLAASRYKPKHILAIDSVVSRLEKAAYLGAEPWNYQTDREGLDGRINQLTDGRGVDVVLEIVGARSAMQMAFQIIRPWGMISSVGVHSDDFPFSAGQAYDKNIQLQMGRCPVSTLFPQALECLREVQDKLDFLTENIVPLSEAAKYYEEFNNMRIQKVIFDVEN